MKKIVIILFVVLATTHIQAQFSKATLQATGLTCALCSNAVNKSLEKISFIEKVKSDIKNTAFNIQFKAGAKVDVDAIKKAVEDAGFSVGALKLTGNFDQVKVENDKHINIAGYSFHFLNVKEQVLNGEQTITVVDKNFVSDKAFKTIKSYSKMECVQTGKASHCCTDAIAGSRMYHATI